MEGFPTISLEDTPNCYSATEEKQPYIANTEKEKINNDSPTCISNKTETETPWEFIRPTLRPL